MAIEHLNENNFEAALAEGKCLVDFWATWVRPLPYAGSDT